MSKIINENTCKYVVIDVNVYEKVLEFIERSGGGSFREFRYSARPVIGELVATPDFIPYDRDLEAVAGILTESRDDFGTSVEDDLLSQAVQAIRRYVQSL